ncbi:MAG: flagellar hook protein FlgE [Actinobacteria bacterium]|nr:flagellar hook protein FlgE [Actinomycetota bacterium]
MMRSMFSGVSGLRNHQTMMDVVGNNIANVNTVGFKSSQLSFQDALCQTIRGAKSSGTSTGGTNPIQIGLGVKLALVSTNFSQGSLQNTGRMTDLSIQGDGFFVLSDGGGQYYTRAGYFSFDAQGKLINPSNGYVVQGWMADSSGRIDTNTALTSISIPVGQTMPPSATTTIRYQGNLPSDASVGDSFVTEINVRDSQGMAHAVTMTFTKAGVNSWDWEATGPAGISGNTGTLSFDSDGLLTGSTGGPIQFTPAGAGTVSIVPDFGTAGSTNGVTQFASASTVAAVYQDGYATGSLQSITISDNGVLAGFFSNGLNLRLAQIAVCVFNNPEGLIKVGDSMYRVSNNSGEPLVGTSGSGNRGVITAGTLEMSNVDLAQEFTNMIIAERGFQANSRIITSADQMLQDLVNIKR